MIFTTLVDTFCKLSDYSNSKKEAKGIKNIFHVQDGKIDNLQSN